MSEENKKNQATDGQQQPNQLQEQHPNENVLTFSKSTFDDRLNQAKRSAHSELLSQLGFASVEEIQTWKADQDKLNDELEQKRLAEMDELSRTKALAQKAEEEKLAAEQRISEMQKRHEAMELERHLTNVCLQKKIANVPYALFRIGQACDALPDENATLDENEFLDELMKDPSEKAALGIETKSINVPVTTSTNGEEPPPKADDKPKETNALQMSQSEFSKFCKDNYDLDM